MTATKRTMELLIDFILAGSDEARNAITREIVAIREERNGASDQTVQTIVEDILTEMGVPCHLQGYDYIATAVCALVEDERLGDRIVNGLYAHVAHVHHTTPNRVERAIRHAIEIGWDRCNADELYRCFGNTVSPSRGRPTNSEFIWMMVRETHRREESR